MEISSALNVADLQPDLIQKDIKPLKGYNFESDVQRFEQILFDEQNYVFKGVDSIEKVETPSVVSKLGESFFEKAGDLKKSTDKRVKMVSELLQSQADWKIKDILTFQWQVSMFTIESTLVTSTISKADEGIKTLFRNQ